MKNRIIFDTKVQLLKYEVLKQIATLAWEDTLLENVLEIPEQIIPGNKPSMRCCVYKERAVLSKRIKLAIGGNKNNKRILQVIDIACEDCPKGGYDVTSVCRGCLAHKCEEACKRGAISFGSDQKACIDKSKCVDCGACSKVCPFHAIINYSRPCESSCRVHAISAGENREACIDYEKCISCGACAQACPFGAITDRSDILDCVDILKKSDGGKNYKTFALVAPSVAGQFPYATFGQLFSGIKALGFTDVAEVALGADIVASRESGELKEKGFLISSCCPAFVSLVEKKYPHLKEHISANLSPAGTLAKLIKEKYPDSKTVFIGPCTAKKSENRRKEYLDYVDCVLTFEELQALLDGRNIELDVQPDYKPNDASYFGRIFARTGGLSSAVERSLKQSGDGFELKSVVCNGIDECEIALLKASKGLLNENFIEGMACKGGCIGGAGCINHNDKNVILVERYAKESENENVSDSFKKL